MNSLFALTKRGNRASTHGSDTDSQFDSDRNTISTRSGVSSLFQRINHNLSPRDSTSNGSHTSISEDPSSSIRGLPPTVSTRDNARLSREIASVCHMLRDMYSLDLRIFGAEGCRLEDEEKRKAMIADANILFQTVRFTIDDWDAEERRQIWTEEELEMVHRIRNEAYKLDPSTNRRRRGDTR